MGKRYEIRLSGSGGQGIILASVILGEAAALYEGKFVLQSQVYGAEARGGASRADVIIDDEPIDYVETTDLDMLLSLTQDSFNKFKDSLKEGGTLIVDSVDVKTNGMDLSKYKVVSVPIIDTAVKEVGKAFVANVVALGVIASSTGVVKLESLEKALLKKVPKGTEELNRRALKAGFALYKS